MKTCAICGQAAERGSMCRDCRAALKRARDETVSQFQPKPALAMVGDGARRDRAVSAASAAPAGDAAASPTADRQHRHHDHTKRPVARRDFPTRGPRPAPAPEAMPGRTGASRFVWVIVTLMVLVVSYVAYGVISAGIEGARSAAPPAATKEPAAVRPPPAPAPRRVETMVTPSLRETQLGYGVQEEVERRMGAPVAPEISAAVPPERPREAARHGGPDPISGGRPAGKAVPAPVRVETEPPAIEPAPPKPVVVAAAQPPAPRAVPRRDRWERMDAALRSCGTEDFLGRVICEQKVRLEYCEGQWGQAAQCPGAPANDHGQ